MPTVPSHFCPSYLTAGRIYPCLHKNWGPKNRSRGTQNWPICRWYFSCFNWTPLFNPCFPKHPRRVWSNILIQNEWLQIIHATTTPSSASTKTIQVSVVSSFSWAHSSQKTYLGNKLTSPSSQIFKANYALLLSKISKLSKSLSKATASWAGKIALAKLFILPHVLYFFRTIPLLIPAIHLETMPKIMNTFIWSDKRARVWREPMFTLVTHAGLGTPDLAKYSTIHLLF